VENLVIIHGRICACAIHEINSCVKKDSYQNNSHTFYVWNNRWTVAYRDRNHQCYTTIFKFGGMPCDTFITSFPDPRRSVLLSKLLKKYVCCLDLKLKIFERESLQDSFVLSSKVLLACANSYVLNVSGNGLQPCLKLSTFPWYWYDVGKMSWNPSRAGIIKKSMGARNRGGIGLSYRPAGRIHSLESIPGPNAP
jgi:hypothetical protein